MIVASMLVKANLANVKHAINGQIRDGIILPSGNVVTDFEMKEYTKLGTTTRCVWCVNQSTIIAEQRADNLTELKLLAVKGIVYNDGTARRDWRLVENEFKQAGLLVKSVPNLLDDAGKAFEKIFGERALIEQPRPELEDKREFTKRWRAYFKTHPVYNRNHQTRQLPPQEIKIEVEELWEIAKRRCEEDQARWDEIHRLAKLTTGQATEEYFAKTGGEDAKRQRRATETTRLRAETFKEIKDQHPEWGYDRVAMKAAEKLKADNITAETVRNAYKAMGWKWERADRVR